MITIVINANGRINERMRPKQTINLELHGVLSVVDYLINLAVKKLYIIYAQIERNIKKDQLINSK